MDLTWRAPSFGSLLLPAVVQTASTPIAAYRIHPIACIDDAVVNIEHLLAKISSSALVETTK